MALSTVLSNFALHGEDQEIQRVRLFLIRVDFPQQALPMLGQKLQAFVPLRAGRKTADRVGRASVPAIDRRTERSPLFA
ncbi:hypothetical protein [Pyramidobacter porci]